MSYRPVPQPLLEALVESLRSVRRPVEPTQAVREAFALAFAEARRTRALDPCPTTELRLMDPRGRAPRGLPTGGTIPILPPRRGRVPPAVDRRGSDVRTGFGRERRSAPCCSRRRAPGSPPCRSASTRAAERSVWMTTGPGPLRSSCAWVGHSTATRPPPGPGAATSPRSSSRPSRSRVRRPLPSECAAFGVPSAKGTSAAETPAGERGRHNRIRARRVCSGPADAGRRVHERDDARSGVRGHGRTGSRDLRACRLDDPHPGPEHAIEGFADRVSVAPGEPVRLYVSTTAGTWTVTAFRLGADARSVWTSPPQPGRRQAAGRRPEADQHRGRTVVRVAHGRHRPAGTPATTSSASTPPAPSVTCR